MIFAIIIISGRIVVYFFSVTISCTGENDDSFKEK